MEKMTLEEAVWRRIVNVGDYFSYLPVKNFFEVGNVFTGSGKIIQSFSTEKLQWKLENFDGVLFLIAATPTKEQLSLSGKCGAINGVMVQTEIATSCYYNPQIASKVGVITQKMWEKLSSCNKIDSAYWIGTNFTDEYMNIQGIERSRAKNTLTMCSIAEDSIHEYSCGIRPVVKLKTGLILKKVETDNGIMWGLEPDCNPKESSQSQMEERISALEKAVKEIRELIQTRDNRLIDDGK